MSVHVCWMLSAMSGRSLLIGITVQEQSIMVRMRTDKGQELDYEITERCFIA